MRFSTLLVSAFAALAGAYTPANTSQDPSGNAISAPGLNELIPAGQDYTIKWDPTTEGKVSLILLRGPSTNVKYLLTIAEDIDNSGSYTWSVPSTLEPDTTHYGVELIVEGTGQYQYSTQCGVSNAGYSGSSSSSVVIASSSSSTAAAYSAYSAYSSAVAASYSVASSVPAGYGTGTVITTATANASYTFATSTMTASGSSSLATGSSSGSSASSSNSSSALSGASTVGISMGALFAAGVGALMM